MCLDVFVVTSSSSGDFLEAPVDGPISTSLTSSLSRSMSNSCNSLSRSVKEFFRGALAGGFGLLVVVAGGGETSGLLGGGGGEGVASLAADTFGTDEEFDGDWERERSNGINLLTTGAGAGLAWETVDNWGASTKSFSSSSSSSSLVVPWFDCTGP